MTAVSLALAGIAASILVVVAAIRLLLGWLNWRNARALSAHRAQCLLADAEALRAGKACASEREWGRAA